MGDFERTDEALKEGAAKLVDEAERLGDDRKYISPFAVGAAQAGYRYRGGYGQDGSHERVCALTSRADGPTSVPPPSAGLTAAGRKPDDKAVIVALVARPKEPAPNPVIVRSEL